MPDEDFDPDAIALMESALTEACIRTKTSVAHCEEAKTLLASRVIEGVRRGIRDQEDLIKFALQAGRVWRG